MRKGEGKNPKCSLLFAAARITSSGSLDLKYRWLSYDDREDSVFSHLVKILYGNSPKELGMSKMPLGDVMRTIQADANNDDSNLLIHWHNLTPYINKRKDRGDLNVKWEPEYTSQVKALVGSSESTVSMSFKMTKTVDSESVVRDVESIVGDLSTVQVGYITQKPALFHLLVEQDPEEAYQGILDLFEEMGKLKPAKRQKKVTRNYVREEKESNNGRVEIETL